MKNNWNPAAALESIRQQSAWARWGRPGDILLQLEKRAYAAFYNQEPNPVNVASYAQIWQSVDAGAAEAGGQRVL